MWCLACRCEEFLRIFTELINAIGQDGSAPEKLVRATMVALDKGNGKSKDAPKRYRLIHLLEVPTKVVSVLLVARSELLAPRCQFGFVRQKGTRDCATYKAVLKRRLEVLRRGTTAVVNFDLREAFPSVSWESIGAMQDHAEGDVRRARELITLMSMNAKVEMKHRGLEKTYQMTRGVRQGDVRGPPVFNEVFGRQLSD